MEAPQAPADAAKSPAELSRGGWLTSWLVLIIVANLIAEFYYLTRPDFFLERYPRLSPGGLGFLRAASLANIAFLVAIWNWRRAGVWAFVALALLLFAVSLYIGVSLLHSVLSLVGPGILVALLWPKWKTFK